MKGSIRAFDLTHGVEIQLAGLTFPGGEPHVGIEARATGAVVWVDARVGDAECFMRLLATLEAMRAMRPAALGLFLPYFPGARQDRRQLCGAFTAKVYADCLRTVAPDEVVVLDPHSDVVAALLDVHILPIVSVLPRWSDYVGLICPDAGAEKRANQAARWLGLPVFRGRKVRDPRTGALSGFGCEPLPEGGGRFLVVDDICDGGGTFLGLADACLRDRKDVSLDLWVTHGIFSKGVDALLQRFDRIVTTDSFPSDIGDSDRVRRVRLHEIAERAMRERLRPR